MIIKYTANKNDLKKRFQENIKQRPILQVSLGENENPADLTMVALFMHTMYENFKNNNQQEGSIIP